MTSEPKKVASAVLKEMAFFEGLSKRCPDDIDILTVLGDLYTKAHRYEEGLDVDRQLVRHCPEKPLAWYNLACSQALVGQRDEALHSLGKAVDLGYRDAQWMLSDGDLESLRGEEMFRTLLHRIAG
ncbi:MAG: hypothetical protein HY343_04885 [Lentisphaerae bacterium]|nr:hypothetical protein [Lentisphaerota bacterium]